MKRMISTLVMLGAVLFGALLAAPSANAQPSAPAVAAPSNPDAAVAPAPTAASKSTYQKISEPRPHCYYYHHLIDGAWRGTAYKCDTSASGDNAYQARVVCHDDVDNVDRTVGDPTPDHKPYLSLIDCPNRSGPVRGGYLDPV